MSYDYDALVSKIATNRRQAAKAPTTEENLQCLQESVSTFSALSSHCPMTPLLWMQYGKDTADLLVGLSGQERADEESALAAISSARDTRLQLLELALSEFPGSAILHLHYLQVMSEDAKAVSYDKMESAILSALQNVGKGSHRNEGVLVAAIYQLAVNFYTRHGKLKQAITKFIERAKTPIKDVNETLTAQLEEFCSRHSSEITPEQRQDAFLLLDDARRYESKTFNALIACEDDVDLAMHKEGVLPRHQVDLGNLPWDIILRSDDKTCWMGYGGMLSANAFIQYTQTCYRYKVRTRGKKGDLSEEEQQQIEEDENAVRGLTLSVYERGIAECPTVETLWLSYIKHLEYAVQIDTSLVSNLKNAVNRSVRNCPYSLALYQRKLYLHGHLADLGVAILDPDELQQVVQEACDSKFISSKEACLELYITAMRVLRRRLLSLLTKAPVAGSSSSPKTLAYDEPEPFSPTNKQSSYFDLDDATSEELEDLCDDCRDFYETTDTYLKKHHPSWSEGRGRLGSERAYMEAHFLGALSVALGDSDGGDSDVATERFQEVVKSYDKLVKVYQPTPPDVYTEYITTFQNRFPVSKPSSLIAKIRQARLLYQNALKSLGRPKNSTGPLDPLLQRDFDSGLRNFCYHYLVFERYFGSEKSLKTATVAIQKKLAKFSPQSMPTSQASDAAVAPNLRAEGVDSMQIYDKGPQVQASQSNGNSATTSKHSLEQPAEQAKPLSKKRKTEVSESQEETKPRPIVHKVKVGNMEYPAHPFTVRVSNLAPQTEDMDLVDTVVPMCGAVVHAKIMREKHHHHHGKGKSKGWGLIQFESQESVEKALSLSDVIGIREKLVTVDRSHLPAVGLVPPGMHRVNPKGEGKSSKKNQKKREAKESDETKTEPAEKQAPAEPATKAQTPASSTGGMGILDFKPRGVQKGRNGRKVKISLRQKSQQTDNHS